MSNLERRNGRFYVRLKFPVRFRRTTANVQREIRLSLFTYNRLQAKEQAQACWLAFHEILRNPENFKFSTMDELRDHIRAAAMAHSTDQYTALIELTGTAHTDGLAAAVKFLLGHHTEFFVLVPPDTKGTLRKRVWTMNGASWDWELIAHLNGQTFPHLKIPTSLVQDAITCELDVMEPETLTYSYQGEERMLKLATRAVFGFHHLFVRSDLDPKITTSVRKLTEAPAIIASTQAAAPVAQSKLLLEEIERYCKEKTTEGTPGDKRSTAWSEETADEQKSKLKLYEEIVGNKPVLTIGRDDHRLFLDKLRKVPKHRNRNPKTRGKPIEQVLAMNLPNVINPKTVVQYHITISAFFDWLEQEYIKIGPIDTSIKRMLKASGIHKHIATLEQSRVPFTDEHLSLMFASDAAIDFLSNSKVRLSEKAWKLWLPVLGVTSGARLNELCSFQLADIGEENGIHYMDMNLDNDEKKSLKNRNAKRRIPLHPVVIELGFLKYVEYMRSLHDRKTKEGRLFPDLTPIKGAGYRKYATEWFNQDFLVHLGIKTSKLNFHSYRWYVLGVLQRKATSDTTWRIDRYVGHEHGKKEPASIRFYMAKSLADTVPVLDDLKFTIDWSRYEALCRKTYK